MADLAVYEINDYLWNGPTQLKSLIARAETPFYPVQQQPEPNAGLSTAPYIIYTSRTVMDRDQWYIMSDTSLYTVWAKTQTESVPIVNDMIRHLRRVDDAATDVNAYLANRGGSNIEFLYIRINEHQFPGPVDQEGADYGRRLSVVSSYIDKTLC